MKYMMFILPFLMMGCSKRELSPEEKAHNSMYENATTVKSEILRTEEGLTFRKICINNVWYLLSGQHATILIDTEGKPLTCNSN